MSEPVQAKSPTEFDKVPSWFSNVMAAGFTPYVAASEHLLTSLNLKPFGVTVKPFIMQKSDDKPFLDAYLSANFLSFGSKDVDYKMPSWVYVDCVLSPTAVAGFMLPKAAVPSDLLAEIKADTPQTFKDMKHIPLSGQVDTKALDGSYVNFSLFSLGRRLNGFQKLALYTKALSTEVHGIRGNGKDYRVILQYNNPSMKVHGLLSSKMEIEQPTVPLHPSKAMTLIAKMFVDYDPYKLDEPQKTVSPSFWMEASDAVTKKYMQARIDDGYNYSIVPPYTEKKNGGVFLPIKEHSPQP